MKKRILSIFLAALMIFSLLPVTAAADFTGWTALTAAGGTLSGTNYYLNSDITLTSNITVNGNVTIDLNGYVLDGDSKVGSVIYVNKNATLTIQDSRPEATHYFNYDADGAWTWNTTANSGTALDAITDSTTVVEVTGGCITGGNGVNDGYGGGGVYVYGGGTLDMSGGNIVGNSANGKTNNGGGGGVYLTGSASSAMKYNGTLKLSGTAKIIGNAATSGRGGGVFAGGYSMMTMTGGEIAYNYANDTNTTEHGGGGVMTNGTFTMTGGSIHHNVIVFGEGGGVYSYQTTRGTRTLGGSAKIINNVKGGDTKSNLFVAKNGTTYNPIALSTSAVPVTDGENKMDIGVAMTGNTGKFTTTTATSNDYLKCFTSDNSSLNVYRRGDNTLWLLTDWGALGNELAETTPKTMQKMDGTSIKSPFTVDGTKITLDQDFKAVTGDTTLTVKGTKTLDLAGFTLDGDCNVGSVIMVKGNLTLTDSSDPDAGTIIGGMGTNIVGGEDEGAYDYTVGGGVFVDGGTFNLYGGTISGNNISGANSMGGGVFVGGDLETGGTFNMYGGTISGNVAYDSGAGVCVGLYSSTGIPIAKGTFNMSGGTISENLASDPGWGGGVCVTGCGTFNMSGTAEIKNNTGCYGGGVHVSGAGEDANFTMTGGTISGNTANVDGGGVCNYSTMAMLGGTITGNTCGSSDYGGGIDNFGTLYLGGTAVVAGNLMGTAANDVENEEGKTMSISTTAPAEGMRVGLYGNSSVVTGASSGQEQYFFSDDPTKEPAFEEDKITLKTIPPHTHDMGTDDEITFTAWTSENSLPGSDNLTDNVGSFYLTKDVTLDATWTVPSGTVNLCLNGHVIKQTAQASVITVGEGATLNIYDCDTTTVHNGYVDANGLWHLGTGTGTAKTITGGIITGGTKGTLFYNSGDEVNYYVGGGVFMNGGSFTMNGGTISGNLVSASGSTYGGGVYVNAGSFTMNAGEISGNKTYTTNDEANTSGGGVFMNGGKFTMTGGTISGNESDYGGGVYVANTVEFTMTGGEITRNSAVDYGGGVFADETSTVVLGGTAIVRGNKTTVGDDAIEESNIHLQFSSKSILECSSDTPLTEGANIGVTVYMSSESGDEWQPGTEVGSYWGSTMTDNNYKYFVMNNSGDVNRGTVYGIEKSGAQYVLVVPPHVHNMGTEATTDDITFTKAIKTFANLQDLFTNGGSGYLAANIDCTAALTVAEGKTVDLCLDDKVLDLKKLGNITVAAGATFNLYDCGEGTTRYYDKDATTGLWTLNTALTSGNYTTTGGVITGGTGSQAGGVFVGQSEQDSPAGKLTMKGGNIVGNTSSGAGGGVYLQTESTFDMDGGSIVGNNATKTGGGVGLTSASFTMTGGEIKNNNAGQAGGGVYSDKGTFTMTDGEIDNNTATMLGGGVGIGNGTFTMTGGKISGNNATSNGGGVYYNTGTITIGGTAQITGNTAGSETKTANNLYLPTGKTIALGTGDGQGGNGVAVPNGMSVGVTAYTAPSANSPVAITNASDTDYHSYFFADKAMKEDVIAVKDDANKYTLYLAVPTITVTQTGTNPTYGTAMSADEDFFTVAYPGFGTAPTLKLEWKSVDGEGKVTWSTTAPTGITASLTDKKISIATAATLGAGSYVFRVTNSVDEKIEDPESTTEPKAQIDNPMFVSSGEVTLTVEKVGIDPTVSITGWTYGETADSPSVTGNSGEGTVTYTYKVKDAQDSTYTETVPTNAGEYTVKAEIAATDIYAAGSHTADFAIAKRPVTLVAGSAEKDYDGLSLTCTDYTIQENTTTPGYGFINGEGIQSVTMTAGSAITEIGTQPNVIDTTAITAKSGTNLDNYAITTENGTLKVTAAKITDISVSQTGELTFSGQPQMATVSASATTVNSQTETFTYCTTEDGAYTTSVPGFTDAGDHTVYYKVTAPNHEGKSGSFTVTIGKATVEAPTINSKVYTSGTLTADVAASERYTVTTNAGGTAVGSYDVILTLSDTTNYKWSDSETADKTLKFQITQAGNSWATAPKIENVTYGTAISPVGEAKFGDVTITYVGTSDTVYASSTTAPTDAGTYKATFAVAATNDYGNLSTDVTFTIAQKEVGLEWSTLTTEQLVYDAAAKTLTAAATGLEVGDTCDVTVELTEGKDNVNVGAFTYTAKALSNANYKLPTGAADVTSPEYTITPKPITVTPDAGQKKTYGENDPAFTYTHNELCGTDAITGALSRAEGENYSENGYAFTMGTLSAGSNYQLALADDAPTFMIEKKPVTVLDVTVEEKIYNDETEDVAFSGAAVFAGLCKGDTLTISGVTGTYASANAGSQKVTLGGTWTLNNANYKLAESGHVTYAFGKIGKAPQEPPTAPEVNGETVTIAEADREKKLEYRLGSEVDWLNVPALNNGEFALYGLAEGNHTIYLRMKESTNYFASPSVSTDFTLTHYSVAYHANGGVGSITGQTETAPVAVTVKNGSGFHRTGYTFSGWNTAADGSGTAYAAGASISSGATLYAQWTANTYTVKFSANGGSGTMADQSFTYDADATALMDNKFTRENYTFVGWATSANGPVLYSDAQSVKNLAGSGTVTLYAVWAQNVYSITVNITSPQSGDVQVKLQQGNAVYAVQNNISMNANGNKYTGSYSFAGVPAGTYNIEVTQTIEGGKNVTMTQLVVLTADSTATIALPASGVNSKLEVKEDTRPAVVGGLEAEAETNRQRGKDVTVKMTVEKQEEQQLAATASETDKATQDAISEIKATANGNALEFMNIEIEKTTTDLGTSASATEPINETEKVLELVFSYEMNGKRNIKIYREHDGEVQTFGELTEKPAALYTDGTYYVDKVNSLIYVYAQKFSTYAIGYEEDTTSGGSVGGGSSAYAVTGTETEHGGLTVSRKNASAGSTVTVTVMPEKGYRLDKLTVLDRNGREVAVTSLGDNKYSFQMPNSRVTVSATFAEVEVEEPIDEPIGEPIAGVCLRDASCPIEPFTDTLNDFWWHDGIHFCIENKLMQGIGNNLFDPNGTLSRAMIVTILWRIEDEPTTNYAMSFGDVPAAQWYTEAIRWAQSSKIVEGYSDEAFGPNDNVTREQLAAILMRYAAYKGIDVSQRADLSRFTDANAVSGWALENVRWAVAVGMINGRTETTIVPTGDSTRAEAATMVQRFCEKVLSR